MKVGDLVELSAQGNKLDYMRTLRGLHGIVLWVKEYCSSRSYVHVHWFGRLAYPIIGTTERRHLKFLKVKK